MVLIEKVKRCSQYGSYGFVFKELLFSDYAQVSRMVKTLTKKAQDGEVPGTFPEGINRKQAKTQRQKRRSPPSPAKQAQRPAQQESHLSCSSKYSAASKSYSKWGEEFLLLDSLPEKATLKLVKWFVITNN